MAVIDGLLDPELVKILGPTGVISVLSIWLSYKNQRNTVSTLSNDSQKDREALIDTFREERALIISQIKTEREISIELVREIASGLSSSVKTIDDNQEKRFDRLERQVEKLT